MEEKGRTGEGNRQNTERYRGAGPGEEETRGERTGPGHFREAGAEAHWGRGMETINFEPHEGCTPSTQHKA